jgi:phosphate transport system substrate-binding protein
MKRLLFLLTIIFLAGCSPAATPTPKPVFRIYASSAVQPWLAELYQCADRNDVLLSVSNDPASADVSLRLGETENLTSPAFKIDDEEILVVTHLQAGISTLPVDQVRAIFSGQVANWSELGGSDVPVEVWVYSEDEDIQQLFNKTVMDGLPANSMARLAVSAQHMSDSVGMNPGSIGFLPRRWKAGNTHETLIATTSPVLAITRPGVDEAIKSVLACLQK